MKTHFITIYCNGRITIIAVQANSLIEAKAKAVPAFRSFLKLKRALIKADKEQVSIYN